MRPQCRSGFFSYFESQGVYIHVNIVFTSLHQLNPTPPEFYEFYES